MPESLISLYHLLLAKVAAIVYRHPSREMIVVGITGTGGKSSTVYILAKMLESAGLKVGATSTLFFKVGELERLNNKKMTMLGRFQTQKFLRRMAQAGCHVAIIETTSQGIMQSRHRDIDYDIVALTNLYPEHLEAHGGFENYKKAKGRLFDALQGTKLKSFVPFVKTIIANADDEHASYFLSFPAGRKICFGLKDTKPAECRESVMAEDVVVRGDGLSFNLAGQQFDLPLLSIFNLYNALCAISVMRALGLDWDKIHQATQAVKNIPGRFEYVEAGQPFKVMVDYAFEPRALSGLYELAKLIPHQKIIHVLGSAGGGRDSARRPILGEMAGRNADYVIITNEDPYDDEPLSIIRQVADGALVAGKVENQNLFLVLDRREAIKKALSLAGQGDLVLITGKGAEQAICVKNGRKITWDDRVVVREELASLGNLPSVLKS